MTLYFAYASNLNPAQMWRRCPNSQWVSVARLPGYTLAFTRFSKKWNGGVADVVPAEGRVVWGVIYQLDEVSLEALDASEGFPEAYQRDKVSVERWDGSSGTPLLADVYRANPMEGGPFKPSKKYLETILTGANNWRLPPEYVDFLKNIETA